MIALFLWAVLQSGVPRVGTADVEFRGPCAGLRADLPGGASIDVGFDPPLSVGEERRLRVAVPWPAEALPQEVWKGELARSLAAAGPARLERVQPPTPVAGLEPALMARPRPDLGRGGGGPGPSWSMLFVLGAVFAIQAGRRRRALLTTLVTLAACASLWLLVGLAPRETPRELVLYEARLDGETGEPWLEVSSARDRFLGVDPQRASIEVQPPGSALGCRTEFSSSSADGSVSLTAPAATLHQLRSFDPGGRALRREVNALGDFGAAWFRESGGSWRSLGPWAFGDPMPEGSPGDPPGRWVPDLPLAGSLFLGRLADPSALAARRDPAPQGPAEAWIRASGM